jgi:hypothetical protein
MPVTDTAAFSSLLGTFTGQLEFTFGPHKDEPMIIANKLDTIARELNDFTWPLVGARQIAREDMKMRFDSEKDLSMKKWKKRSDAYLKEYRAAGYDKTILRRNDHLYDAVTNIDSYVVAGNNLYINTASWPSYWEAHDQGYSVGRSSVLPQRQFAGISESAQFDILGIFDHWLLGTLDIVWASETSTAMHRGAFGRFGGKISLGMDQPRMTRESSALILGRPT